MEKGADFPEVKTSQVLLNTVGCEQDQVNGPLAQDEDCGAVILCGFNPYGSNTVKVVHQFRSTKDPDLILPGQCPVIIINGKGKEKGETSDMKSLTHVIWGDYSLDEPLAVFLKGKTRSSKNGAGRALKIDERDWQLILSVFFLLKRELFYPDFKKRNSLAKMR